MRRVRTVFIQGLLLLAGLEVLLRLFIPLPDPYADAPTRFNLLLPGWNGRGFEPPFTAAIHSGRLAGVSTTSVIQSYNRYGLLYPESEEHRASSNELRIGVVGGSTVECAALVLEKTWPRRLQELLSSSERPVTVLNLGTSGTDTRFHVSVVAQHAVKLDLDYLVFLVGANDLWRARPQFQPLLDAVAFQQFPRFYDEKWLLTRSQLARYLRRIYRVAVGLDVPLSDEPYFADAVKENRKYPVDPQLRLTFSAAALDDYESNLVSLAGLAAAHGIQPVFLTQPALWKPVMTREEEDVDWLRRDVDRDGKRVRPSSAEAARDLDVLNERLLSACRRRDWKCVDLANKVPKSLEYFYDSAHYNEAGAELVAREVASFFAQELLARRVH